VLDRAYALLSVKAFDGERRSFSGLASTPTPDRRGDILEPLGATFTNPLPLLLHHDRERPVGRVTLTATRDGIAFEAQLPEIAEPGLVRDRVNEAWHSIKAGLITGVSIGFRPLADGVAFLKSGGMHLLKTEICELSLVTVPANVETTIHTIKSYDAPHLAASGLTPPGVSGLPLVRVGTRSTMKPTTTEQITQWENKRAALAARMVELMTNAGDAGATLDAEQSEEYDGLELEVKSTDAHLTRLRALEKTQAAAAVPVPLTTNAAPNYRPSALPQITVRSTVAPGTAFVRYVKTMVQAGGDSFRALEYAKQYRDSTPEVELLIKAAVAPGTTTDATWAGALVTVSNLTNEFIELSRPATILGRIPGLTQVPFNVSVPVQSSGGTYKWVGQAKAKPVGSLGFTSASLGMAKAAGIIVLTEELVRSSSPSAEAIVRNDMIKGIAQFLDTQFTDPAVAEVTNVSPASITNGAGTAASADNAGTDLGTIVTYFSGNSVPLGGLVIIMSQTNAFAMGYKRDALGQIMFPNVGPDGGNANGVTIIASNAVGDKVIGLQPEYILLADDGGVKIDVSREATLQMNDAPVNPSDPATTVWTNMFQDNLVALRAERFINWKKAKSTAAYYLTGAVYPLV
jgi:HK97 family phage major capsid protein/HK97 family phage prohead protease